MDELSFFNVPWLHANSLESRWLIQWRNFALWIIHLFSLLSQIIRDGRTFPYLSEGILISFKHSYSAQIYIFQDLFLPKFFFFNHLDSLLFYLLLLLERVTGNRATLPYKGRRLVFFSTQTSFVWGSSALIPYDVENPNTTTIFSVL